MTVDCKATNLLMTQLPKTTLHWLTKHIADKAGTGTTMVKYKKQFQVTCPLCPGGENSTHVWLCQSSSTQQKWSDVLSQLQLWLETQDTNPNLAKLLIAELNSWHMQQAPPLSPYKQLAQQQLLLGWQSFFEGRPALGWVEIQDSYFRSLNSR